MKCIVAISLAILAVSQANPVKRFAGFGIAGISSIGGGNLGCVVTGNKLYINGLFEKDLSSAETSEFRQYRTALKNFKQEIKEILETRRNASLARRQQLRQNRGRGGDDFDNSANDQQNVTLPDPPQKPSFCTGDATTQYIFDGCKVQNNKVYVGNEYARDLDSDEIAELKKFDEQMTAYQSQISQSLQKQVQEIFGEQFGRIFGGPSGRSGNNQESNDVSTRAVSTPTTPLQAPEAPDFCTVIY